MTINNPKYFVERDSIEKGIGNGIYSIPSDPELIPETSSQDSLGWISTDGQIELTRGRLLIGQLNTDNGYIQGHGFGVKQDGTQVHFRKINKIIQYFDGSNWKDIVTGLTPGAEYTFARYQSLAGTFVFATGADGIYKIHTSNPADYCSMYDTNKNYKGKSIIVTSRMYMWDLPTSKVVMRASYTDLQDSSVYTAVTAEATVSLGGTLAFKAGDPLATCFGVVITLTGSGEKYIDNYNGILVGNMGGTGTINYTTGAYTLSATGTGTADYFWENTNNKGVTDFTYSGTRTATQGDVYRQDEGGDAIQRVIYHDGSFYSLKSQSTYKLTIADSYLTFSNIVFRRNMGLLYWRAAVDTSKGIIFMDTANLDKPQLTILQPNLQGDNLEPVVLASHFNFANYIWDQCSMETFGEFIMFSGRTTNSTTNNKLFMYNVRRNTVDILPYRAKTIVQNSGLLFIGDTQSENVYQILSGFDDDNETIENYWEGNDKRFGTESLKKVKRIRLKGLISIDQNLEVYVSYDNGAYQLIGTIRGDGSYVDPSGGIDIGQNGIGTEIVGGGMGLITTLGSFFLAQLKLSCPKFRKRSIKLVATGIGYVAVNMIDDFKIETFQQRLPAQYRTKQNVSLDGTQTDL